MITMKTKTILIRLAELPFVLLGFLGLGIFCGAIGSIAMAIETFTRPHGIKLGDAIDRELNW